MKTIMKTIIKTIKYIICTVAALLFLSSCTKDKGAGGAVQVSTIEAYIADGGKTTLVDGGTKVYWEPGDRIKAFFGGSGYCFTALNTKISQRAVFGSDEPVEYDPSQGSEDALLYAIYPYDENTVLDGNKFVVTLPDKQPAVPGSFAPGLNMAVGKSDTNVAAFYNVCGGICFTVSQSDIHSVEIVSNSGSSLAGRVKVGFDGELPVVTDVIEGRSSVTLTAPYGTNFVPGQKYYAVILTTSLNQGVTMRFNRAKYYAEKVISSSQTIKRGVFASLTNPDAGLAFDKERENEWDEGDPALAPDKYPGAPDNRDVVGVDHFNRSFGVYDSINDNYQIGMFFWPWIGQPYANGIYDATKIYAMDGGQTLYHSDDKQLSPDGQAHFWGEPLWGYYNSEDEWVMRKQFEMITLAGVDFIYWDHTNAITYLNVVKQAAKILHEMNEEGWKAPKMMSYTHSCCMDTARDLYNNFYKQEIYPDTWHMVNGKPAIICYTTVAEDAAEAVTRGVPYEPGKEPAPLSSEILNYFHFYKPQWPFDEYFANGFPWIDWHYPQKYHTTSGVMSVSVASHPQVPFSSSYTHGRKNWGRGYNVTTKVNESSGVDTGNFFQSEWNTAHSTKPKIVSVGGWNEWIAYKQPWTGMGVYQLVDACSKEYSRDIEPMNGGYQDAFYIQLIRNLRQYKTSSAAVRTQAAHSIKLKAHFTQWNDVNYVQRKPDSKQIARDSYSVSNTLRYSQPAPENALLEVRVTHDDNYVYFFAKTKDDITVPEARNDWFNIYVGAGDPVRDGQNNWESYSYVIGTYPGAETLHIESLTSSYARTGVGDASYFMKGNMIHVAVPRSVLGLTGANKKFHFKVCMGCGNDGDIMKTYTQGSAMPMGRLSYSYIMQ